MTLLTSRVLHTSRVLLVSRLPGSVPDTPDGAPAIVSGPTLVTRTTTSITLTWSADQFVQSWLEYGTSASYGNESAHEESFDYQTHVQTISGLTPGTTYHFKVHVVNQAAQETTGSDATFATEEADEEPGDGISYTTWAVPVGTGWTDGTNCRTALQTFINDSGNGADATHHVRIWFRAGYTWTVNGCISLLGKSHITFWGEGTPQYVTDPDTGLITLAGNSGGGKIVNTSSVSSGDVGNYATFSTLQGNLGSSTWRATDIRFDSLQFEGNMSASIDKTTTMADGGNENQIGVNAYGIDGLEVVNCNFYRLKGDAVALQGSAGSVSSDPSDVRTRGVDIHHNWIRSTGRVGIFLGKCSDVTIRDNLFQDSAYAFIDFEPDYEHMRIGTTTIARNSFTGGCNWDTTYYMSAIFITRVTGRPGSNWQVDGPIAITDNVFADAHKRNNNGSQPANSSGLHEVHAGFGPLLKTGLFTFTGNRRIAYSHTGPALYLANFQAGWTVTGNSGFGSTPTFVQAGSGNSGTQTVSGNS